MEHVEASGHFLLRSGADRVLIASVRRSILDTLARRHPGWVGLDPGALAQRLAERAQLPVADVAAALGTGRTRERERFRSRIASLETIRRAL